MAVQFLNRRSHLLAVAAALLLAACGKAPQEGSAATPKKLDFKSIDITGAEYARTLELPDADGKPFKLTDLRGKVVLVFFGYTQCPDVCPSTLTELAAVKKQLGHDGDKLVAVFVSVDPARDTPALLKAYTASFGADFKGLVGTDEQTKAAAKEFKVFYGKVPGKTEGSYTVDHTAGTYVFDREGRIRLFTRYGSPTEQLVHDLKLLLAN